MVSPLLEKTSKILLHCCCAPCSCSIIEQLIEAKIDVFLFFYNPNIHPFEEYEKRREEICRYARKKEIPFIDGEYDLDTWFSCTKGLEACPERGERCGKCFDMRFKKTAEYAFLHGFSVISSTLSISRWKDSNQIAEAGKKAVLQYPGMEYFVHNWRTEKSLCLSKEISLQEDFYRQTYCGCIYSHYS